MAARKQYPRIEPAHGLLYEPNSLQMSRPVDQVDNLLEEVSNYLKNPFNPRQEEAFRTSFTQRLSLLWGPPGTGKTTVLAGIILGWIEQSWRSGNPIIVGVGASNYNAIDNVLREVADLFQRLQKHQGNPPGHVRVVRLRSQSAKPPLDGRIEDVARTTPAATSLASAIHERASCIVVGGTWQQLGRVAQAVSGNNTPVAGWFDLLVLDEASQIPVAHAAAYFLLMREDGHLVLAGDHKQLGPIYGFEMRDSAQGLFDCIFSYMQETHGIDPVALDRNYRTNTEISGWPRERFYSEGYEAFFPERRLTIVVPPATGRPPAYWPANLPWTDVFLRLLDPELPVVVVSYGVHTSTLSNPFEAQMVTALALLYRRILGPSGQGPGDHEFWTEHLGIVTPHRAQMSTIRNLLVDAAGMPMDPPPFVDTVDRFQGQERDLMIASYVVADRDFVAAEEAFILNPRRFNVTLTRARSKFIMFVSDAVLQHLPADADVARDAAHLQLFAENYCTSVMEEVTLPYLESEKIREMTCRLRGMRDLK
jgi:hypothetical protein